MYGTITAFRGAHVKIIWQLNYIRGNPYQWNRPFLGIHFATFSNSWLNQFCTLASFSSPSPFLFFYHSPSFFFFRQTLWQFWVRLRFVWLRFFLVKGGCRFWAKSFSLFLRVFFFIVCPGVMNYFSVFFFFLGGERVWFSSTGAKCIWQRGKMENGFEMIGTTKSS